MKQGNKIVLVAGIGTSPAVLTETVWALAHQKKSVVPDEVVVISTTRGKAGLKKAILDGKPSVWESLKAALDKEHIRIDGRLKFTEHLVKVMLNENGEEMDDLRDGEDNLSAADFMLHELRAYTDESDTTVLCSIAGGRKTMSALIFSCMSLVGREQDKVYHVLIPPEYECGMEPPFFFPQKGVTHQLLMHGKPTGTKVASAKVGVELFEVPFVRMRGWYQEKFSNIPPSYRTLVRKVQGIAPPAVAYPKLEIDAWKSAVKVNGIELRLGGQEFAALIMLANGTSDLNLMFKMYNRLSKEERIDVPVWLSNLERFKNYDESKWRDQNQEVSKIMTRLRDRLLAARFAAVDSLVPKRNAPVTFPIAKIRWINRDRLEDICGYLFSPDAK